MDDQRPGDGQHLALSAREVSGGGPALAGEIGKSRIHFPDASRGLARLKDAARDLQIVLDRHQRKDVFGLGHEGKAEADHGVGRC